MNTKNSFVHLAKQAIYKSYLQISTRRRIALIVLLLYFAPSLSFAQGYKIETTVLNSSDTVAYLGHHFATQRFIDDTTTVVNGKAIFSGTETLVEGIYFYYTPETYFEFLIDDQHFELEASAPDFIETMQVTNSKMNYDFYELQRFTSSMKTKNIALRALYDSAANDKDKEKIESELNELDRQVIDFQKDIKNTNSNTFLARLITLMQSPIIPDAPEGTENETLYRYNYYKNNFWNGIDIADQGLLRTPLLDAKINDYLDNVILQQSDSVIKEVDILITKTQKSKEAYRYLLITLINKYELSNVIDFDKVFVHLVETYYLTGRADEWTNIETLDKLRNRIAMIKPNFIGKYAPELILWDTLGFKVNLKDIHAEYTVLYFYDPDCGHCKKKTPMLYAEYPELVAKGVEVLAICTGTNEQEWKDFIKKDDLNWINLADLESQTNVKYYYDIRSTPTVYIVDKDKKIIIKKIDALDISNVIDQFINQKEVIK